MANTVDMASRPAKANEVDSAYAWWRLVASMAMSSIGGVGLWSSVVLLTEVEKHFDVDRGTASLPYTAVMIGIMLGNVFMGRLADRFGVITPVLIGSVALSAGYAAAAFTTNLWLLLFIQGALIGGLGTSSTFGPLIAAISHWFIRHRGIAVALVASGSYVAGTIWPPIVEFLVDKLGWRDTHLIISAICIVTIPPFTLALRRKPPEEAMDTPGQPSRGGRKPSPVSLPLLQALLFIAGIACCVAMSMPQVHIVAYCVDLDLGKARGAEMLSIMLGLGVISRIGFGMLMDRIGALWTLLLSSSLQALSLLLYVPADGLYSLYLVSALFGLFQGGIVPTYAVIIRDYFPASQAGTRVGLVLSATMGGMAIGAWLNGEIYDLTLSYTAAFLNGFAWNLINMAIVVLLLWRGRLPGIAIPRPRRLLAEAPLVGRWPGALQ
jgi:MFS family permease